MNKGYLRIEGGSFDTTGEDGADGGNAAQEDILDASGNKIDRNAMDTSTDKEKRKKLKDMEKKLKDGLKKGTFTDEEKWALEDEMKELQEKMEEKMEVKVEKKETKAP